MPTKPADDPNIEHLAVALEEMATEVREPSPKWDEALVTLEELTRVVRTLARMKST